MTQLRFRYQTIEFGRTDIHLCTLRNTQEFQDPDGVAESLGISSASWPLFGVIWPSSLVLAHFLADCDIGARRVLEVGCGMALSSLLLNKREVDVTATDYHPEAEKFLQRNTSLNGDSPIAFELANWSGSGDTLGLFDLIIGSDLLYEDEHVEQLAGFIQKHAEADCEVIVVDPGRGRKSRLNARMKEFGFHCDLLKPQATPYLEQEFKGHILRYSRGGGQSPF